MEASRDVGTVTANIISRTGYACTADTKLLTLVCNGPYHFGFTYLNSEHLQASSPLSLLQFSPFSFLYISSTNSSGESSGEEMDDEDEKEEHDSDSSDDITPPAKRQKPDDYEGEPCRPELVYQLGYQQQTSRVCSVI